MRRTRARSTVHALALTTRVNASPRRRRATGVDTIAVVVPSVGWAPHATSSAFFPKVSNVRGTARVTAQRFSARVCRMPSKVSGKAKHAHCARKAISEVIAHHRAPGSDVVFAVATAPVQTAATVQEFATACSRRRTAFGEMQIAVTALTAISDHRAANDAP